jgi:hypothetical protein
MPTRDYDAFERWVDSVLRGTNVVYNCKTNTITVKKPVSPFEIQSVLSNRKKNAFTVVWADGTHTTVHCQPGDDWDDEKALAMCFAKKALGNKGNFNDKFNDALDNKRKVIPGSAGVVAEKKCDCDGTCEECKCEKPTDTFGVNAQTATELGKAANKASNSLKEMINALTSTTSEPIKVQRYNLFLMDSCGDATEIYHQGTDEEIHKAMRAYRMKHYPILEANRTPYRVWQKCNCLYVDFGAGSYFMVPGMDHDTFVKGK